LKLTSKITAAATFGLTLLTVQGAYSFPGHSTAGLSVACATAQASPDGKELLQLARKAIDQKQFAVADTYIRQAEANWSKIPFTSFGDTPKKVRRDLEAARSTANGVTPPSRTSRPLFTSPFGSKKPKTQADPFRNAGQNVDALLDDKKGQAVVYLRQGREAQAQGNQVGAEHFAKRALEIGAQFGPQEDSPQRLWSDLTGGAPLPAAPTRQTAAAPPVSVNQDLAGMAFKPMPPRAAPGRVETAPPNTIPATSQMPGVVSTGSNRSGVSRAVYDPYADQSRAVVAGGVLPEYPRTAQADAEIQLVAGVEDPAENPIRAATATAKADAAPGIAFRNTPSEDRGELKQIPKSTTLYNGEAGSIAGQPSTTSSSASRRPPVANSLSLSQPASSSPAATKVPAMQLIERGEQALRNRDPQRAAGLFRQAAAYRDQLDPATAQRLQDHLQLAAVPRAGISQPSDQLLQKATEEQLRLRQQINFEVKRRISDAVRLTESDPSKSLQTLTETAKYVQESGLSPSDKQILQNLVQQRMADVQKFMHDHRAQIALNETNASRREQVDRRKQHRVEVDQRLAKLVDDFNRLRDEGRYAEAVILGKKARELAPDNRVAMQLWHESKFIARVMRNIELSDAKSDSFLDAMINVEEGSVANVNDDRPVNYGRSMQEWEDLSSARARLGGVERKRNPKEIEIENALRKTVSLKFREQPLSEVINHLKSVSGINIHLDQVGLGEERVHPSTPVTIDLEEEISLKSALNLILEPLHLSYVIQNEVLKITSEHLRDNSVHTQMYNVADLVIPLPNFSPHNTMGLPDALSRGYGATLGSLGGSVPPVMVNASPVGMPGSLETADALAQTVDPSGGFSSGGRGGATNADFDPLIELITTTIEPDSWEEAGGAGRIAEFETNLSLVVSSTQDVHDKIRDLLEQLRRLQDLQVTIEVRFIQISDQFFERIGVDFNMNIDDKSPLFNPDANPQEHTATVGIDRTGSVTENQDIQIINGSFGGVIPGGFAGFDPVNTVGTTVGFAILSDIEAFFFIEAAQSDRRSNLLQAPKVTLFNGQAASVSSQTQRPFVTSVIPVVGDFAAAQAPVIAVLPEGTTLSVQAVVSADRRYVRLTLIPFFSEIRDVETFTFTGSTTSTESASDDSANDGDTTSSSTAATTTTSGTTIQLPEFEFTTVTTTVSVPDGGTVLLGGIKQLTERRREQGTPILAKLPYISRLFKNVGIGRETSSLMLMVTPRIIIQEEEELRIGL